MLCEVLTELGHRGPRRASARGWAAVAGASAPWRLGLAYSVAFQLLNMVEEHAAGEMRVLRESATRDYRRARPLGRAARAAAEGGPEPEEMLAAMQRVRVEPVLTAHPTEAKRLAVLRSASAAL